MKVLREGKLVTRVMSQNGRHSATSSCASWIHSPQGCLQDRYLQRQNVRRERNMIKKTFGKMLHRMTHRHRKIDNVVITSNLHLDDNKRTEFKWAVVPTTSVSPTDVITSKAPHCLWLITVLFLHFIWEELLISPKSTRLIQLNAHQCVRIVYMCCRWLWVSETPSHANATHL